MPPAPTDDALEAQSEHEVTLVLGDRRYRVRGWKKPLNPESLKVNLLVHRANNGDGRFHVDTFDLYSAKARAAFVKLAGIELGEAEDTLKHDLGRVLLKLEALQEAELGAVLARDERPVMSDEDRAAALELLRSPDLMARIAADLPPAASSARRPTPWSVTSPASRASWIGRWPSSSSRRARPANPR